ncbi:MAG TPA: urease accessory protein UreE [Vicinamibacterales bacterium]|jgi:urease accessory protein
MIIIDRVWREDEPGPAAAGFVEDTITLDWEARQKGHARRRTDQGIEFATSLPQGTMLREGDRLRLDPLRRIVTVREAQDEVYVIRPRTAREWAWLAYQIGNRHQPLMIAEEELICPRTPDVEQLLQQLGVALTAAQRPFTPAIARVGHHHE